MAQKRSRSCTSQLDAIVLSYVIPRNTRSTLFDLTLLDELRTYCYEHTIEEMPAFLTA